MSSRYRARLLCYWSVAVGADRSFYRVLPLKWSNLSKTPFDKLFHIPSTLARVCIPVLGDNSPVKILSSLALNEAACKWFGCVRKFS